MSNYGQSVNQAGVESATRERPERERRLLDAGLELFMRYGFDKTTVAEIAKGAGVSKGAVYLHFKSKDELFEALLRREMSRFNADWMERIEADERGGTIAGMFTNLLRSISDSPFVAAILRNDASVLGSYLSKPDGMFRRRQHPTRQEFIERMQAAGAIRAEVDPQVTAHIMNMLSYGLVSMNTMMNAKDRPSIERLVEGIGDLLDRALTPANGGNPEAGKAILRDLSHAARKRNQR